MGFSHFHELGILSGMYIFSPYQIDSVKECGFYNDSIILIRYFFLPTNHDLEDENNIYLIFYFLHVFVRKLIIVSMISEMLEILRNSHQFT